MQPGNGNANNAQAPPAAAEQPEQPAVQNKFRVQVPAIQDACTPELTTWFLEAGIDQLVIWYITNQNEGDLKTLQEVVCLANTMADNPKDKDAWRASFITRVNAAGFAQAPADLINGMLNPLTLPEGHPRTFSAVSMLDNLLNLATNADVIAIDDKEKEHAALQKAKTKSQADQVLSGKVKHEKQVQLLQDLKREMNEKNPGYDEGLLPAPTSVANAFNYTTSGAWTTPNPSSPHEICRRQPINFDGKTSDSIKEWFESVMLLWAAVQFLAPAAVSNLVTRMFASNK